MAHTKGTMTEHSLALRKIVMFIIVSAAYVCSYGRFHNTDNSTENHKCT